MIRLGHGIDAHRFEVGRTLMLGCITVPHHSGLAGHSDGDVAAHALGDALLGAAGLGDLGRHFPSGEERWRDISGAALLADIGAKVRAAGYEIESAQVVIIAEAPRLQRHAAAMVSACAEALGAPPGTIAISATTTDGLGFAGRGEGIAASAVALLREAS